MTLEQKNSENEENLKITQKLSFFEALNWHVSSFLHLNRLDA